MTPLQFARSECANYRDGKCQGIYIRDDGSLVRMPNPPKTCNVDSERCVYFEECVAPMAVRMDAKGARGFHDSGKHYDTIHMIANRKVEYMEAARLYRHDHNVAQAAKRSCPACGRALEPRKQLCYVCRGAAKIEANRRKNANRGDKYTSS